MKKKLSVFFMAFLILCLCINAPAKDIKASVGGGLILPTGDAADAYKLSFAFQGAALYELTELIQLEGQFGYWILQDDLDREDFSAYVIPLVGGFRYSLSPTLHVDAGAGIYLSKVKFDTALGEVSDSESDLGIYGGAGYLLNDMIDICARIHFPDFDDMYFSFSVAYLFNLVKDN